MRLYELKRSKDKKADTPKNDANMQSFFGFDLSPELKNSIEFAKINYPGGSRNQLTAILTLLDRARKHGLEADADQNELIDYLKKTIGNNQNQIDQLRQEIQKLNNESPRVYNREEGQPKTL